MIKTIIIPWNNENLEYQFICDKIENFMKHIKKIYFPHFQNVNIISVNVAPTNDSQGEGFWGIPLNTNCRFLVNFRIYYNYSKTEKFATTSYDFSDVGIINYRLKFTTCLEMPADWTYNILAACEVCPYRMSAMAEQGCRVRQLKAYLGSTKPCYLSKQIYLINYDEIQNIFWRWISPRIIPILKEVYK